MDVCINHELPVDVLDDPRIGKLATHLSCGGTAPIERILRFSDGYEVITTMDKKTGLGHGDSADQFVIQQ